jgi:hypothetical protein
MGPISRPIQVLLAVTVLLAAVWFVALRPKSDDGEPASPPSARQTATPFGRAVERAQGAANATAGGVAPAAPGPVASGGTTTAPATASPGATPAAATATLPPRLARALTERRVVVLLFWNRAASDDRAVRAELSQVSRRGGRVVVAEAPLSQLARYGAITRGVQVLRSPTLVVIDRSRRATTLSGYTDAPEIDQTISDVLRARAARAG